MTSIKVDPYLNIGVTPLLQFPLWSEAHTEAAVLTGPVADAGTFSPYEHGEVYVLDDGGECDLDLGNYERFLDITLTRDSNITTGKIYKHVMDGERRGSYLGKTVQGELIRSKSPCVRTDSLWAAVLVAWSSCSAYHERDSRLGRACGQASDGRERHSPGCVHY